MHSSWPVNGGSVTPNPNVSAPWASTVFSCPRRDISTFSFAAVMPYLVRQPMSVPNGE